MNISNALAIAAVNAITAKFNIGGAGKIEYYDGSQPADVDTAVTSQNLLGTTTLPDPAFPTAVDSSGSATATGNAIPSVQVTAAGTPTWARVFDGNGLACDDGDVGLVASGADFEVDDLSWELNDNINANSFTISIAE